MMLASLRWFFFEVVGRFLTLFVLGLNIRGLDNLPGSGPAIVVANHNSHLDVFVMVTILKSKIPLSRIHPVAAADYFGKNRLVRWFTRNIIGAILIPRKPMKGTDPLQECRETLERNECLVIFPEGSRGDPEIATRFKGGVAHLVEQKTETKVYPVFLHGLGKALPRGEALLVPFICDVVAGSSLTWEGDRKAFTGRMEDRIRELSAQIHKSTWD